MPTCKRLLSIALSVLFLAGCGQAVKPPKVVYVEVAVKEDIPEDLIKDCPVEEPTNPTVKEALRVAAERKTALLKCNEDKAALRVINQKGK